MPPNRLRSLAAVAAALLTACGPKGRGGPASVATVVFTNDSVDRAEVYAVSSSGGQFRIGTVEAGRTDNLRVPVTAIGAGGTVNVVARITARPRNTPSSGPFQLAAGDRVAVRLSPDLRVLTVLPLREP